MDLMSRTVTAPDGEGWAVSPRWNLRDAPVKLPTAWRRRKQGRDGDDSGWLDVLDIPTGVDDLIGSIVVVLVVAAVFLVAWFLIWPLLAIAVEALIVLMLIFAGTFGRVVLRRPWIVEAKGDRGGRLEYAVRGYGAMRRVLADLAAQLELGNTAHPQLAGATELLPR